VDLVCPNCVRSNLCVGPHEANCSAVISPFIEVKERSLCRRVQTVVCVPVSEHELTC